MSDFKQGVFVNTVSVGGAAAKYLQESLSTKQKLLAAFGKLGAEAAETMTDVLDAMATAAQKDVEVQAESFISEQHAAIGGAITQGAIAGGFDVLGTGISGQGSSQAKPYDLEAAECEKMVQKLKEPITTNNAVLNARPANNVMIADENGVVQEQVENAALQTRTTQEGAQKTADGVLKSLDAKKGNFGISKDHNFTSKQADIEKISNEDKTVTENGQPKIVKAREYYADQFEKKAQEFRDQAQKIRDGANSTQANMAQRANMYSSAAGSLVSSSINLTQTAGYKEDQEYTASAQARNQSMGSMASSLQSTATSNISEATKEAQQQAQIVTQTQSTK